ncbi:MAG: helix-turn-helix transcriptional regulator [Eubacteriales bacterium]|jgi:transcriptional regulator with XRE-family HTH domain
MALKDNIKTRRLQLKLSQEYVADQLGISRQAVAKWESGASTPTAANLAQLAALFDMSLAQLTEDRPDPATRMRKRGVRMAMGRVAGYVLVNTGWDGYSSGLYSDALWYWLGILGIGLVLVLITSVDMQWRLRHKMTPLQLLLGLGFLLSVFYLPELLPFSSTGLRYLLADLVSAGLLILLHLKYWRPLWMPT